MATTTAEAIRDRILTVIEAITPSSLSVDKFRRYRNERGADFVGWAEENQAAAFRRFQVRDDGSDAAPEVSDATTELRSISFTIIVAYPQTNRAGRDAALDRDDLMSADQHAIEHAVGLRGYANFAGAYPNASWTDGSVSREVGDGVDFLVIRQTMRFYRSVA